MGKYRGRSRAVRIALAAVAILLAAVGSAAAFQALPPGNQVNNDPAAGIDPAQSVSGQDPTNADVVGGALVAGKPAVPWAVFRQQEAHGADQVFSRSFAGGAWLTRGNGTVGGRSSASPTFAGSLNFDQGQDGEAPSIDFAGAGRTVPWATWYENTTGTGFGNNNVFASRFDAASNKWVFAGQSRGDGGGTGPNVPSLNIHTDQNAENPSVAGGSALDPTKPGPWVTWQETTSAPVNGKDQIFVSKPIGPGTGNCDAVKPAGLADGTGHVPAIGGFCFQDVGAGRVGPAGADPSLNVDVTRNGVEPDIAFTGANDSVPWVVWYEKDPSSAGLANNELVFAAKAESDTAAGVLGGFHWHVIGNTGNGILNGANSCAASPGAEQACSLNHDPTQDAEDPQLAAGTMNPANPTAPWVAWDETVGGVHQVFVSRFVAAPSPHFQIVNAGAPISTAGVESTRPDIAFSGNTPYVSWREETSAGTRGFYGHFVNAANPTLVLDESDVPLTPTAQADVREPISSACIATPFNQDGQACQGGAIGTPFFLFTNGSGPRSLFADAYQSDVPVTLAASGISTSAATITGTVNPRGAAVKVFFQFGTSTAYGQSTPAITLPVGNSPTAFTASLSGLPAGTVIHYRALAQSDFGTLAGADQTLTTASPAPTVGTVAVGGVKVHGKTVAVELTCSQAPCQVTLNLTARGRHHRLVHVGTTTVTLQPGATQLVRVSLNGAGRHLLAIRHVLRVKLAVIQSLDGVNTSTLDTQTVIIKIHPHNHR